MSVIRETEENTVTYQSKARIKRLIKDGVTWVGDQLRQEDLVATLIDL